MAADSFSELDAALARFLLAKARLEREKGPTIVDPRHRGEAGPLAELPLATAAR